MHPASVYGDAAEDSLLIILIDDYIYNYSDMLKRSFNAKFTSKEVGALICQFDKTGSGEVRT